APLRLHGRRVATRPDLASVPVDSGLRRHQADVELPAERSHLIVRHHARVRARNLRTRRRLHAGAYPARQRRLARPPRVAEPDMGEPRRSEPPLLAILLSAPAEV